MGKVIQDQTLTILTEKASCLFLTLYKILVQKGTHLLIWQVITLKKWMFCYRSLSWLEQKEN